MSSSLPAALPPAPSEIFARTEDEGRRRLCASPVAQIEVTAVGTAGNLIGGILFVTLVRAGQARE